LEFRRVLFRSRPGDDRPVPDHVPVAGHILSRPVVGLLQRREAGLAEPARGLLDGVEGRGRGGDEGTQVLRRGAGGAGRDGGGGGQSGRGGHSIIEPSLPSHGSMRSSLLSPTCSTTSAAPVSMITFSPV